MRQKSGALLPDWLNALIVLWALLIAAVSCAVAAEPRSASPRPNLLVIWTDSWTQPKPAKPDDRNPSSVFDRLARQGVFFENAFGCSSSERLNRRVAVTGRWPWQTDATAMPLGTERHSKLELVRLLQQAGYKVGFCCEDAEDGLQPDAEKSAKMQDTPLEPRYNSPDDFFRSRAADQPFCFLWFVSGQAPARRGNDQSKPPRQTTSEDESHRPRVTPITAVASENKTGKDAANRVARLLGRLRQNGRLNNTLIVLLGWPVERPSDDQLGAFDFVPHLALAAWWPDRINGGRVVRDLVSVYDLAPTLLDAAGLPTPHRMTGRSFLPVLLSDGTNHVDPTRWFVVGGADGASARQPARVLRTADFVYLIRLDRQQSGAQSEELCDLRKGANATSGVADQAAYRSVKTRLRALLESKLRAWRDPRFPTPGYEPHNIEGWTVLVSKNLRQEKPELTKRALQLTQQQLRRTVEVVPAPAVAFLRTVPIWVSPVYPNSRPRAEYHPNVEWLKQHHRNPALAKCVELSNVDIFEKEVRRMPVFVLHELAHAYHDQVLGFNNPQVQAAYEKARASGKYEQVKRWLGSGPLRVERHYGMNNAREYFAESTEAFFDRNDFFPFTRDELSQHDPVMFKLLRKLWLCDLDHDRCGGEKRQQ